MRLEDSLLGWSPLDSMTQSPVGQKVYLIWKCCSCLYLARELFNMNAKSDFLDIVKNFLNTFSLFVILQYLPEQVLKSSEEGKVMCMVTLLPVSCPKVLRAPCLQPQEPDIVHS
jgi:hypothetical protein